MDEFERIATYFAPLATDDGAFGLTDDAAAFTPPDGQQLVITQDTLVEGIHFTGAEPAALIAQKALRVNLSDLAAKGAEPFGYLLSLSLSQNYNEAWIADFCSGLAADQQRYDISLLGGDSTASNQGIVITLTAIGYTPKILRRSTAKAGDILYVTGTIGDATLGLQVAQGTINDSFLLHRYQLPQPRIEAISLLREFATAAMDISDGLLQDAQHLSAQSKLALRIRLDTIPLSDAAKPHAKTSDDYIALATGGDDYECLFTVAPENRALLQERAAAQNIAIHAIGQCAQGNAITLSYDEKAIQLPSKLGYCHS